MKPNAINIPRSPLSGVPGWLTNTEEYYMRELAKGAEIVIEIGCEYGRSASIWAASVLPANGRVYCIDKFPEAHPEVGDLFTAFSDNLREAGLFDSVTALRGTSADILRSQVLKPEMADILFIDAGHTFIDVMQDLEALTQYVKPGGIVLLHDVWKGPHSHPIHAEVRKALETWHTTAPDELWHEIQFGLPDSLASITRSNYSTTETFNENVIAPMVEKMLSEAPHPDAVSDVLPEPDYDADDGAMTITELADFFGVARTRIYEVVRERRIEPTRREGRSKYYKPEDFGEAFGN